MLELSNFDPNGIHFITEVSSLSFGGGCGSVVRAVASNTRDTWFESRHWHNFIYQLYNRKDKNKEKVAGNGPSIIKEYYK